ncbi:UDP-N-acetylglucosamine--N-acetylmuramyl-(pentapeptide) pyrophosphoryl-undecaprenol N-acetylglucosamine transferase [Candidatus Terasakiella magnetica]|uniref:UDP-N-acetylglucosamine--N-acetylmuramyl-(pentapeptide) pyrophosphoryl-undecaprenol N-acetylglucosamine transferase n=1 Tax=Candidatus Terasakiella magnetica TaxID=1867952 RepID=A0A1C3RJE9_9PROT|nr:undecaprenyldiphospho-muramoylpentapeptide beta-N-acetylglucosaminyltransferase [Candidatus Terasakiella magnetica]SCA57410.1 UDP-N-acetylglucosamine--N-acetylmuramyl-(pentapeptide) pyrophosphoryl-undecaprenol N-acetylglucosamine transferase [Candidatus Terasakiella magnetica]
MSDTKPLVILAAGGTGGHVFPAESLASELQKRGYRLALFTDKRGGNYSGVLGGLETKHISAGGVAGRGFFGKVRSALSLAYGTFQAKRLLGKMGPSVVVGFGGYASVPTMIAASIGGFASMIHEQNAVLGRANRLLAPKVKRICTSFEHVDHIGEVGADKVTFTGMPVRENILALRSTAYTSLDESSPIEVLILGGSQGAQVFSDVLPESFAKLPPNMRERLHITQQCRPELLDDTRKAYKRNGMKATLESFFDDVPERLAKTHLLIARSGASTCAEVTAVGRPSILVPYPYAIDDHQSRNAHAIDEAGAGWLMPQEAFDADILADRLEALFSEPQTLNNTAAASLNAGRPDAASRLADAVEELIEV